MEFDDGVCSDLFELLDLTLVEQSEHISHGFLWGAAAAAPTALLTARSCVTARVAGLCLLLLLFFLLFLFLSIIIHHANCIMKFFRFCVFLCAILCCVCVSFAAFFFFRLRQDISTVVVVVIFSAPYPNSCTKPKYTHRRKKCDNDMK